MAPVPTWSARLGASRVSGQMGKRMATYLVVDGIDYPGSDGESKRAEPGDYVDDVPAGAVEWLVECGHIVDPEALAEEAQAYVEPEDATDEDASDEEVEPEVEAPAVADHAPFTTRAPKE